MCTLSWKRDPAGQLDLWFNRDELKSRLVAEAPSAHEKNGVRFLSPRDPEGGGAWMLANEHGVVICLLNRWELEGRAIECPRSRGLLVHSLATLESLEQVHDQLAALTHYRAFTLAIFTPSGDRSLEWNGVKLTGGAVPPFMTSSSWCFEKVRGARAKRFCRLGPGREFHAASDESPSPLTVRMNRPDAQTWSRSHLQVNHRVRWHYLAEKPDLAGPPEETVVELARS